MAGYETLFSLEVAVECMRLQSSTITCRLPAVAFRLLDFPTLLVHHVEGDDASKIRDAIFMNQELNGIPPQLQELKDHKGNFILKKGKSCMFKMKLETLDAHLCSTPLYVMLVDTWPDVPKLVANCTVSLKGVIQSICNDVQKSGIEMPSVHGVRGSYKLYNLMGSEIGWIVLGLRLLSLGGSLMSHIPNAALVTRKSSGDFDENDKKAVLPVHTSNAATDNDIAEDLKEVTTDKIQDKHNKTQSAMTAISSVDVKEKNEVPVKSSGTQTVHAKSKGKSGKHLELPAQSRAYMPDTNLIISNTHCPPPLFFNADLPVNNQHISSNHVTESKIPSLINVDIDHVCEQELNTSIMSSMNSSEATSISSREQYTETHHRYNSHGVGEKQTTVSVRKTHRKQVTSKHQVQSLSRISGKPGGDSGQAPETETATSNLLNHSQMPILSALLQELSLLHGDTRLSGPKVECEPKPQSDQRPLKQSLSLRGKDNLIEANFSTERHSPYRHKHEECVRSPRNVPSKKGWLRKEPKVSKQNKTKLRYGMTNTQKLRLQKNNPGLLKRLEEQEDKVQSYRRSLAEKVQQKKAVTTKSEANDLDVSTEIKHHVGQEMIATDPQSDNSGDLHGKTHESSKKRRPIPSPRTPRFTDGATFKWTDKERLQEEITDQHDITDQLTRYDEKVVHQNYQSKDEISHSEKSVKSGRSIDVYLPTPMIDDSYQDDQEPLSQPETPLKPITSVPGFPSMDSTVQDEDAENAYSVNFDSSRNFESTGEQVLPHLSQSSSNRSDDPDIDLSKDTHSSRSFSSSITSSSHTEFLKRKDDVDKDEPPPPGRLNTGYALPKPLLSTKSPVPLAMRRSSRPSLQIQLSAEIEEDRNETPTPPTPKPRQHLQPTGSRVSSYQPDENHSTSQFSSKDSEINYKARSKESNKEYYTEGYSEDFNSSDSN